MRRWLQILIVCLGSWYLVACQSSGDDRVPSASPATSDAGKLMQEWKGKSSNQSPTRNKGKSQGNPYATTNQKFYPTYSPDADNPEVYEPYPVQIYRVPNPAPQKIQPTYPTYAPEEDNPAEYYIFIKPVEPSGPRPEDGFKRPLFNDNIKSNP